MELRFDHLSLNLRGRQILNDISGELHHGKVTAILGANGAGKTSLLSCLAGLRTPGAGTVMLGGQPLPNWASIERARHIALLPQQGDIHWDINVRALVALGRLPHHGRWNRNAEDDAAIDAALAQTNCTELADRTALKLSGGEQARVLLARVLAGQPDWILADEPLANLDLAHQLDAAACLTSAAQAGAGVVLVLHDLTQAARTADYVIIMKQGTILTAGPTSDVLTKDIIAQAFGVSVHIGSNEDGAPIITPISRL